MKVWLSEFLHPDALRMLSERVEIISDKARLAEIDAAINRNLRMDRAWMARCPRLKLIAIHGTGIDGVDLQTAQERGIRVFNMPGENAESVAELIVALALMLARKLPQIDRAIQAGEPQTTGAAQWCGMELHGKTFGMIGCGEIARRAWEKLRLGFGMRAVGYSPSLTPERAARLGIDWCASPEEVAARADVLNIGAKLTEQTHHLVDAALLRRVKPNCILINTARGGIVDEQALYDALRAGQLAGAACDVFAQEPLQPNHPLLTLPNFIATPHIGANTDDALRRVSCGTVRALLRALEDQNAEDIHWV